jgi:isopentenyl diphosphate isomerase/L-lactate dehydrogenase-like FMN-dependent dehydrogenase
MLASLRLPPVGDVLNVEEMRARARRRVPRIVFDTIDGGSGDELTKHENERAFQRIGLRPRALVDVSSRELSTTVLGQPVATPILLGPCGFARLADGEGEHAAARSAARAGTVFVLSGAAGATLEEVAESAPGPLWYQLYLPPERDQAEALLERVEAAGYGVLCVAIDMPVLPLRDRDYRNKLTLPLTPSPRLLAAGLSRPAWALDFVRGRVNGAGSGGQGPYFGARAELWRFASALTNLKSVSATDIAWLRERWRGKLVIKGVQRADECMQMAELGVDGVIVSNHGGRNLDGVAASIDVLPEVVAAVGERLEVLVDGGIRRGSDVLKALALGARAVLLGRAYMFGLAADGEAGVDRVLSILGSELDRSMALAGCPTIAEIDRSIVSREEPRSGLAEAPARSRGALERQIAKVR